MENCNHQPSGDEKIKEFVKLCCAWNTSPKLALWTSVTAITLFAKVLWHCTSVVIFTLHELRSILTLFNYSQCLHKCGLQHVCSVYVPSFYSDPSICHNRASVGFIDIKSGIHCCHIRFCYLLIQIFSIYC